MTLMNKYKRSFLVLGLALFLQGCLLTRNDLRVESQKKQTVQFESAKADLETQIVELQSVIRTMTGRVDELENKLIIEQADKKEKANSEAADTSKKFKLYEEALTSMEKKVDLAVQENEALKNEIKINSQKIEALSKMKVQKAAAAKVESNVPKGNYSRGEYYFAKKDWQQAILGFKNYRDMNPGGRKYLDATYKIGVCFQELGLAKEASVFYKEVINKDANSKQGKQAKTRLQALKK